MIRHREIELLVEQLALCTRWLEEFTSDPDTDWNENRHVIDSWRAETANRLACLFAGDAKQRFLLATSVTRGSSRDQAVSIIDQGSAFLRAIIKVATEAPSSLPWMNEPQIDSPGWKDLIHSDTSHGTQIMITVFICHSSNDQELCGSYVELLQSALGISASNIRCTSLPGYQLAAGTDFTRTLPSEASTSNAFVVLLTRSMLSSFFCGIELGARLSHKTDIITLRAGLELHELSPVFTTRHCPPLTDKNTLINHIEDLGRQLSLEPARLTVWDKRLNDVLKIAQENLTQRKSPFVAASVTGISEQQDIILKILSLTEQPITLVDINKNLRMNSNKLKILLDELVDNNLVDAIYNMVYDTRYKIGESGVRYAMSKNWI